MEIYAIRLTEGMDLKIEIQRVVKEKQIKAGIILSSVGCVSKARFRVADGINVKQINKNMEILSLNGTLSPNGVHLHISYSNQEGVSFGGHLVEGNIVNTTCELVIGILGNYKFTRVMDPNTGYGELITKTQEL
ncbi:MAG: PPC domain-containing DNA-binding protein [Psychrilyobacter sp.]|uniref:PPC domain-containing DNA-binding protein n=1 Tax=Psychrilyobacter sp. TaxID=2586924 RepID=UPI003C7239A0